jgi:hypothetical protein
MRQTFLLVVLFTALLVASACGRADFTMAADAAAVKQALSDQGVSLCVEEPLAWTVVPGFVEGTYFELDTDCAQHAPTHPGVRLWIARFDRADTRDAALMTFEGGRRHLGSGNVWSHGPFVIAMDGHHDAETAAAVRQVLAQIGAQ